MGSRQGSRGGRPSTTPVGNSKFSSAFNPTPLPARPTTVYGFAEMDVLSPADVLRRHLNVFNSANTGNLPSLKPKRHNLTLLKPRTPYRVAPIQQIVPEAVEQSPHARGRLAGIRRVYGQVRSFRLSRRPTEQTAFRRAKHTWWVPFRIRTMRRAIALAEKSRHCY